MTMELFGSQEGAQESPVTKERQGDTAPAGYGAVDSILEEFVSQGKIKDGRFKNGSYVELYKRASPALTAKNLNAYLSMKGFSGFSSDDVAVEAVSGVLRPAKESPVVRRGIHPPPPSSPPSVSQKDRGANDKDKLD
jgi:hypothetical protein